jgi:hypothetical protein
MVVFCLMEEFYKKLLAPSSGVYSQTLQNLQKRVTHGAEPFLRSRQLCSHSRTSEHFMGPEGSLPCSQETEKSI